MQWQTSQVRVWLAVAVLALTGMAIGCGDNGSPASPSQPSAAGRAAATAAGPASAADVSLTASIEPLNPTELEQRGWTCFAPPVPNRIVCSRPNQGFPTVGDPPPADRPASFTFLVFDAAGRFVGTEVLIRTELYKGQICESTGAAYFFVSVIGYYECVHTAGSDGA